MQQRRHVLQRAASAKGKTVSREKWGNQGPWAGVCKVRNGETDRPQRLHFRKGYLDKMAGLFGAMLTVPGNAGQGLWLKKPAVRKGARLHDMANTLDEKTLANSIEDYFAKCDETAERVILKSGSVSYRQTPYTLAGLSERLGIPQQVIRQKAESKGPIGRLFASAMRRIERYTVERALLGELQYSVAAMLLRDLDSGEKLPPEEDSGKIVIVLEDKEGWSE